MIKAVKVINTESTKEGQKKSLLSKASAVFQVKL